MLRKSHRLFLGLTLPLFLYACGSSPTSPTGATAFYGDGLDHSWTARTEDGQQLLTALSSSLNAQGVDLGVTLKIDASNGWGPIEINTSNGETAAGDGKTLTLKGQTYSTGLGVHGDSEIHIKATGLMTPACTRFRADIGIDDEVGANGKFSSVVFQVFADGEKLYDSGLVTGATPTKHLDLPVGGKSDLRFVVTHGPDLNYYDHADWAGARLDCSVGSSAEPGGRLDSAFGSDGQINLPALSRFIQVLPQPDGRLLAVVERREGISSTTFTPQFLRYTADGRPDPAYSQQGQLDLPNVLSVQEAVPTPDGKVYLDGPLQAGETVVNFVSRHLGDGRLDPSFGNGGVLVVSKAYAPAAARLQPDGKLLVLAGEFTRPDDYQSFRLVLTRYTETGARDSSYGQAGRVFLNAAPATLTAPVVQHPDGRTVIAYTDQSGAARLTRYTPDGQPDPGFGQGGVVGIARLTEVTASAEQPDGRLLVAGLAADETGTYRPALLRYTANGQPDAGFGNAGLLLLPQVTGEGAPTGLAVQADGRVLVALSGGIRRVTAGGQIDTAYGTGGRAAVNPANGSVENMALQPDGRLLVNTTNLTYPEVGHLLRLVP